MFLSHTFVPHDKEKASLERTTLFFDLDGTCAKFRSMNEEYTLRGESRFFHMEDLYEQNYFAELPPHKNVVETVRQLFKFKDDLQIDVACLSSYLPDSDFAASEKLNWVAKYIGEDVPVILTPCGHPKKDFIETNGNYAILVDDYSKNLIDWQDDSIFQSVKMRNTINGTHGTWIGPDLSVHDKPQKQFGNLVKVLKSIREFGVIGNNPFDKDHQL